MKKIIQEYYQNKIKKLKEEINEGSFWWILLLGVFGQACLCYSHFYIFEGLILKIITGGLLVVVLSILLEGIIFLIVINHRSIP